MLNECALPFTYFSLEKIISLQDKCRMDNPHNDRFQKIIFLAIVTRQNFYQLTFTCDHTKIRQHAMTVLSHFPTIVSINLWHILGWEGKVSTIVCTQGKG